MIKVNRFRTIKGKTPKTTRLLITFLLLTPLFWKCISPPDYLGYELIPGQDMLSTKVDTTFSVSAFTLMGDTLDTRWFSQAIVGAMYDGVFGKTKAGILSSVQIGSVNHKFGANPVIDSVFLTLALKEQFGDPNIPIKVFVHELTDTLHRDSVYNALDPLSNIYNPEPIGTVSYQGGTKLKVPISMEWAQKFLTADSVTLADQKEFEKLFNGIYIRTNHLDTYGKSFGFFDWNNIENQILLHYTKNEEDTSYKATYVMLLNTFCKRYIHFEHDYTAADPSLKINSLNDSLNQDSVFYVQGMGGVRGMIRLNDLQSWAEKMPIAINRAQLIIERELHDAMPPDSIINTITIYYKKGSSIELIDDYDVSSSVGGKYVMSKQHYSFNISLHLQKLLNGDIESDILYLEPESYLKPNQSVLRSSNHTGKMKLIITYTKL